jgi:hypothetical protein
MGVLKRRRNRQLRCFVLKVFFVLCSNSSVCDIAIQESAPVRRGQWNWYCTKNKDETGSVTLRVMKCSASFLRIANSVKELRPSKFAFPFDVRLRLTMLLM